ncbi:MAG: OmpA family protein [Saprospiraceae bacterium]
MKALYTLLISSVLLSLTYITPSRYVVQVAAYGSPIQLSHFEEAGLDNVYRQSDQNQIYRYYIGEFEVRDSAESIVQEVIAKGFKYARVIDLEEQRSLCGTPCPQMESKTTTFADIDGEHPFLKTIYFNSDQSTLRYDALPVLDSVKQILRRNSGYHVLVTGHTDMDGDAEYNVGLSRRRARQVRTYFINRGVHSDRIDAKVYGESMPIARPTKSKGTGRLSKNYNRRVVIAIVTQKGELVNEPGIPFLKFKGNINHVPDSLRVYEYPVRPKKEKQG